MKIGQTIKKLRKEKGISQTEFGKQIGVTQTTLSQIENDQTTPHKSTLTKICEVLNVPEQLLYVLSIDELDVPEKNRKMFETLFPTVKDFMQKIFHEDDDKLLKDI
jgi:transcriptional regulator with XRE-family HTH domain